MDFRPIGVFDSGIGGLNVLKSLIKKFPCENFIYVADSLHCPYGTKKALEIKNLVDRITYYLKNENCKAIVIACNTATAQAAHLFDLEEIAVLGVIYPTSNEALKDSKNILILATDATINSGVYQEILLNANKKVFPVKASVFVEPIERGEIGNAYSYLLVRNHLKPYIHEDIDTVILGCTHFALYNQEIQTVFPDAKLINSGEPTSNELEKILKKRNLLSTTKIGKVYLKTTAEVKNFKEQIKIFNLNYDSIEKIDI